VILPIAVGFHCRDAWHHFAKDIFLLMTVSYAILLQASALGKGAEAA